jgi:PTH2 family peptidyl-tRNA hydrolase
MTIMLRVDLGMSAGKMIVQACHAAVEASDETKRQNHKTWRNWKNGGGKKVALECESLEELDKLENKAKDLGLQAIRVQDAGYTELPPGSVTCLAIGRDREEQVDLVTGNLPLI